MKKTPIFYAFIGVVASFLLWSGVCYASTTQNFESYASGTDLQYETGWSQDQSVSNYYYVVSSPTETGNRAMEVNHASNRNDTNGNYNFGQTFSAGTLTLYIQAQYTGSNPDILYVKFNGVPSGLTGYVRINGGDVSYNSSGWTSFGTITDNTWYELQMQFDIGTHLIRYKWGSEAWTGWVATQSGTATAPDTIIFYYGSWFATHHFFVDDIAILPPPSIITITSPTSGSTITDLSTNLVGTWTSIDPATWTDLKCTLNDYLISESSKLKDIPITTLNGNFSFSLSDFGITKNGLWTLTCIVENNYEINFEVPNPTWNATFNITGLPTPYSFTNFDTWYSANVSNYSSPSDWAEAIIGYLTPIFEKIGEFGSRITEYLNTANAYEKGLAIGGVFPVINAYILKIDVFFGGFPIAQFFQWGILLMVSLFVVKVILKMLSFIPFFGGGG